MATINGTQDPDLLTGTPEADLIDGLGGNDTIDGGEGNDSISGGLKEITFTVPDGSQNGTNGGEPYTITLDQASNDLLRGGKGDDWLHGLGGTDTMYGGEGNDTFLPGQYLSNYFFEDIAGDWYGPYYTVSSGNMVAYGEEGDDRFELPGERQASTGTIVGGSGIDTLATDASGRNTGMVLDITLASTLLNNLGYTVSEVERLDVVGSLKGDTLRGGAYGDRLDGHWGNDRLVGRGGDDTMFGGNGDDTFEGGAGADQMNGGGGFDTVTYAASTAGILLDMPVSGNGTGDAAGDTFVSIEMVILTQFDDIAVGPLWSLTIDGGDGNDRIYGGAGAAASLLIGGGGDDTLRGGWNADTLVGGAGADSLDGFAGFDTASYAGAASAVTIDLVNPGADLGDAQGDTFAGIERWLLTGLADRFVGTDAAEAVEGGLGDDTVLAGGGNDTIGDDGGNNSIDAGEGDDVVIMRASTGTDVLVGGAGIDTLDFSALAGAVTLSLAVTTAQATGGAGTDTISGFENVIGGAAGDSFTGNGAANRMVGGGGNDRLVGQGGDDVLIGGAGADTMIGGPGNDTASYETATAAVSIFIGAGGLGDAAGDVFSGIETFRLTDLADRFVGGAANETVLGMGGADTLEGAGGADTLIGGDGDDRLRGGAGDDSLDGGAGIDTADYGDAAQGVTVSLTMAGPQATGGADIDTLVGFENLAGSGFADKLVGSIGANRLDGADGDDKLYGLGGADLLIGGAGEDGLGGGAGADTLIGGAGHDFLSGGADADHFRFEAVTDSAVGVTRDRISDFTQGEDLLDLAAIDAIAGGANDAFTFIGAAAFSGTAGELRFRHAGATTIVEADVTGDGVADTQIGLAGVIVLTVGDFLL